MGGGGIQRVQGHEIVLHSTESEEGGLQYWEQQSTCIRLSIIIIYSPGEIFSINGYGDSSPVRL